MITDIFGLFFFPPVIFKCQKGPRDAETFTDRAPELCRPIVKPTGAQNKVYPVAPLTLHGYLSFLLKHWSCVPCRRKVRTPLSRGGVPCFLWKQLSHAAGTTDAWQLCHKHAQSPLLSILQPQQSKQKSVHKLHEKGMQPTPIFLPGESHGQRSLVGYRPGGHRELDTTSDRRQLHEGRTALAHPEMPLIHKHCSHNWRLFRPPAWADGSWSWAPGGNPRMQ